MRIILRVENSCERRGFWSKKIQRDCERGKSQKKNQNEKLKRKTRNYVSLYVVFSSFRLDPHIRNRLRVFESQWKYTTSFRRGDIFRILWKGDIWTWSQVCVTSQAWLQAMCAFFQKSTNHLRSTLRSNLLDRFEGGSTRENFKEKRHLVSIFGLRS